MFKSLVRITFMAGDQALWDVRWPMVPRVGELVVLPQGRARIEAVIWEVRQEAPEVIVHTLLLPPEP
ncbi:hypothetical protein KKF91_16830 [Myxococcota bacterium]|nr:hypothetical protein [Myxococcota bacterium]MBU1432203.1 hypothetical protein [Myxococcota bacterium]MBU1900195.1 hypothetical protein [Myxococcota bacterium]